MRDPDALLALAARTESHFGVAQLVFPNAGISVSGAMWEMTVDDWDWVLGVNVHGIANTIRAFVPPLLASGLPGHVCITGSLAGYLNQPGYGAYNASKHAVAAIAETLASDLREVGAPVGVTVVAPWYVTTRFSQSARNRPADLDDATPPGELMASVGARLADVRGSAQDAATVAALALDAVKERRFAVFPFAPSRAAVRDRFTTVLDGGVPAFFLPEGA